jgi:hypothetical protein
MSLPETKISISNDDSTQNSSLKSNLENIKNLNQNFGNMKTLEENSNFSRNQKKKKENSSLNARVLRDQEQMNVINLKNIISNIFF